MAVWGVYFIAWNKTWLKNIIFLKSLIAAVLAPAEFEEIIIDHGLNWPERRHYIADLQKQKNRKI